MREAIATKAGTDAPVPFGLLVIPIAFADAEFAPGFTPAADLLPRLAGDQPGSLAHYFATASRGRTRLAVQLAPLVRLPGARLDYSDLGWQGLERSRAMAAAAIAGAVRLGADLAASDRDGDGEVDGVLLLHAGPGLENDPAGLIVPLQYFLAEPVVQRGILARSYAVVSARTSLGLWAHETGHLLGLEDRYDPSYASSSESAPRGGLGSFSLMASGWLGSGAGEDPALPDGYSSLLLGWVDLGPAPGPAAVVRLDVQGGPGPEFLLAEQRYPDLTAPYDATLPGERLLVLHIDETLAEGQAAAPEFPARHLRANLVQADGTRTVARGLSQGEPTDLFPTDGVWQALGDATMPSSRTFAGEPSGVAFTAAVDGGVLQFAVQAEPLAGDLRLVFTEEAGIVRPRLALRALTGRDLPATVAVSIACAETTWGRFAGGETLDAVLVRRAPGEPGWGDYVDEGLPAWLPASHVPPDAVTVFLYSLGGGPTGGGELAWPWDPTGGDLALDGAWPGAWQAAYPTGDAGTRWHRWLDGPADTGTMLACTGAAATSGAAWPGVQYGNRAHAVLRTPPLGPAVRWLEMLHAVDLELQYPGLAVDGVSLAWRHANGRVVVPAEPADGWLGRIETRAWHPLAGRPTFAVQDSLRGPAALPLWRREVLPLPAAERHGPGPWRLELELGSNTLWRARGWLVRDLAVHADEPPPSGFPVTAGGGLLRWTWTAGAAPDAYTVEASSDGGATWRAQAPLPGGPEGSLRLATLAPKPGERTLLRVLAHRGGEVVASRAVTVTAAPRPQLGLPRPNPASTVAHLAVDAAGDERAELALYDLRGRLLRRWRPGGAAMVLDWDGADQAGRRVPAGVYLFRLRALDDVQTRKVTWLP